MQGLTAHKEYLEDASARARSGNKLLIHSLSEGREFVFGLIEALEIRSVCEIGSEGGLMSEELHRRYNAGKLDRLTIVDPYPTADVSAYGDDQGCKVINKLSLDALPDLPAHDLYIVDGDHNYYTVYHELKSILSNPEALVIMHDVCWPCANRDQYYDIETIPAAHRQPAGDNSIHPASTTIVDYGFNGAEHFLIADEEGGDGNGVFAAVEDIAKEFDVEFSSFPVLLGIGFLHRKGYSNSGKLAQLTNLGGLEPLLWRLEENRLTNYLRVIELQNQFRDEVARIFYGRISLFELAKIVGRTVLYRLGLLGR